MRFILLSSCPWGDMLQRPHHIARALIKLGFEVNYIEPSRRSIYLEGTELSMDELLSHNLKEQKVVEGIRIFTPVLKCNNDVVNAYSYQLLCDHILSESGERGIIIPYFPSYIEVINSIQFPVEVVYDCVDDHSDLDYSYWSSPSDIEYEALMLERADTILTTSAALFLSKSVGRDNVFLSKNAVNLEDFQENSMLPFDLEDIPKPRICYVGAIDKWYDTTLFYQIIEANPDKSFVVIGPMNGDIINKSYPNLFMLGMKEHKVLKDYLQQMDVGIIPFKDDIDLIVNCDPIKLYEYLASGIPVVSTALPDLCQNSDFIKTCSNPGEFTEAINSLLSHPMDTSEVQKFLISNTWAKRVEELIEILEYKKKNHEHKNRVISVLRNKWEGYLIKKNNPIIQSLYALTFAESNSSRFLIEAEKAYNTSQTMLMLRNYVIALYIVGKLEEAVNIVLNNPNVHEVDKAELVRMRTIGDVELMRIHLFYCISKPDIVRDLLKITYKEKDINRFELGTYYLRISNYHDALGEYKPLINSALFDESPLYNYYLSKLLNYNGMYRHGQKAYFRSLKLVNENLGKKDSISQWDNLFTHHHNCENCGSWENEFVISRPDGQNIVACNRCGLAFLKKRPLIENSDSVYNQESLLLSTWDYKKIKKDYIFLPRLKWINQSISAEPSIKLLDLGCMDGEFLNYAKREGWDVYGVEDHIMEDQKDISQFHIFKDFSKADLHDNQFDIITIWDRIDTYLSPKSKLNEVFRILKPGGKLFISTPNFRKARIIGENWISYNEMYSRIFYFDSSVMVHLLSEVGFKVMDCFSHDIGDWEFKNINSLGDVLLISAIK